MASHQPHALIMATSLPHNSAPEQQLTLFVTAGNRTLRLTVHHRSRAKLAMQVEESFLGDHAASLPDPLHAFNIYRRHPDFDVLYLNWTMDQLQEGDVLVIRHHTHFCSAVTSPFPLLYMTKAETKQCSVRRFEGLSGGSTQKASGWRTALRRIVSDPYHSWWSLAWATFFGACVVISTGLTLLSSLPRFHDGAPARAFGGANRAFTVVFTAELGVRLLSCGTLKECITDIYLWMDVVAIASDCSEMVEPPLIPCPGPSTLRRSFDLITQTLFESLSMLSTIIFLFTLGTFIMAAVVFSVEAVYVDPMTQLYLAPSSYLCQHQVQSLTSSRHTLDVDVSLDTKCEAVNHLHNSTVQCPRLFQAHRDSCSNIFEISPFQSLMHAGWFTVMTLTSVGYGDIIPKTSSGALVGYVTMLAGIIAISLPISVIASRLSIKYEELFGVGRYK